VQRGEWELPMPLVMGHEGSGIVVELGEGVTALAIGDHVVLSWVAPCGECKYCKLGREAQCALVASVVSPNGVLHDGTSRLSHDGNTYHHYLGVSSYADFAVVPASGAIKVRKDAPLDLIALIGCAVATGVGAVNNTAKVPAGSTVAVIGCGGVGLSVVQGARMIGASRIVAIDINPDKVALAKTLGATDSIVIQRDDDPAEALRKLIEEGVDFAFDAIGHPSTTEAIIRMLALGGAAVIVGLPRVGATASFEPLTLAEADQRILGSNYGSIRPAVDIPWLVDQYMDGNLKLEEMVSARRPLEEAAAALADLENGEALRQILIP
jgi:S-(hydroxymethyl)glutathione dehydrogenase/alcohol dehydrogenase